MKTIEQALAYADTLNRPEDKYLSVVILAAEVRRLREENERLRENAKIIYELEQLAARSNNELLVENERLRKDADRNLPVLKAALWYEKNSDSPRSALSHIRKAIDAARGAK